MTWLLNTQIEKQGEIEDSIKNKEGANMRDIYSIKIIHDELTGRSYHLLADFFRLIGIYVTEGTLNRYDGSSSTKYDEVLVIKDGINEDELQNLRFRYSNGIFINEIENYKETEKRKEYIYSVIKQVGLSEETGEIVDIYVEYKLMYHRNAFELASNCKKAQTINPNIDLNDTIEKAQFAYSDAIIALSDCTGYKNEHKMFVYACMYMAKIFNETCKCLEQSLVFDAKKVSHKIERIKSKYSEFNNLDIIKVSISEIDQTTFWQTKQYWQTLACGSRDEYMSYPIYRAGLFMDKKALNPQQALEYYNTALELNPYNFRAEFQIAQIYKKNHKIYEAIYKYEHIYNNLRRKEIANYLKPSEYILLAYVYSSLKGIYRVDMVNVEKVSDLKAKSKALYERLYDINYLYDWIFEGNATLFQDLTRKRIAVMCNEVIV